jgi:hypothetical protein
MILTSLPVAWRLQWENPGGHSRLSIGAGAACALTVAGQWRSFTALPEHSVAGMGCGLRSRQLEGQPQDEVKLKF